MKDANVPKMGKLHRLDQAFGENLERRGEGSKPHALTPTVAEAVSQGDKTQSIWVDVDLLDDNPFQPRLSYDEAEMGELVDDMNANGQLQGGLARPHPTRKGRYQLAFAHRRKYAVKNGYLRPGKGNEPPTRIYANAGSGSPNERDLEGKLRIEVRAMDDLEMRRFAFAENARRSNIKPLELAKFYADTRDALTQDGFKKGTLKPGKSATWRDVGAFLSKRHSSVHRVAQLLELPANMKKPIESGEMNERHGRALLMLAPWPDQQRQLFADLKKNSFSGAAAEREAERRLAFLRVKAPKPEDAQRQLEEARLVREEAVFDPEEERLATERRSEIALALQTPEEAASLALGTVDEAFSSENTQQNEVTPVELTGTAGVAQIPRLPQLVRDNLHSATEALKWAAQGFDITQVAPDDLAEFEQGIALVNKWTKSLNDTLKRHKEQNKSG